MSAKTPAKTVQPDFNVEVDRAGTKFGIFTANSGAVISHFNNWASRDDGSPVRLDDSWVLSYRAVDGTTQSHTLGVSDFTAEGDALAAAQAHLRSVGYAEPTAGLAQFGSEPQPTG